MVRLGVNLDHVATLRQARRSAEPDPVWAAAAAQLGGADALTVHLREDRRHIQDHDVPRIAATCQVQLNLEMAATPEMLDIACRLRPGMATLVPEGRLEVTTEGGLDVRGQRDRLRDAVARLRAAGVRASAFIDALPAQIEAAAAAGFATCEIHTGPYAHASHAAGADPHDPALRAQLDQAADAGRRITAAGMTFNAGHGLNYVNVAPIAALPGLDELHIGHAIISRAVFIGLQAAVAEMKRRIEAAAETRSRE